MASPAQACAKTLREGLLFELNNPGKLMLNRKVEWNVIALPDFSDTFELQLLPREGYAKWVTQEKYRREQDSVPPSNASVIVSALHILGKVGLSFIQPQKPSIPVRRNSSNKVYREQSRLRLARTRTDINKALQSV
eukprot:CAMPEP_0184513974 /NCGR_PEP_ID=MMETSP0198_2-20121128/3713_1 /TAXON_ID=1112570 /ORGANISM="Thraustochytrium sp., Strain LLF1b" /LENGTH=135 /DNA_ID=CAMNT_0026904127 /DNA_START=114 /DNA_END=521 /DNA_ORIENTATION=-